MYKTNNKDIWRVFREHHYLSQDLNKASNTYLCYWDDTLVGFSAILPNPSGNVKHSFRASRTVILPDYQNLGIGTKFIEFLGDFYLSKGLKYYYRTTHLRLRTFCEKSNKWKSTSHNNRHADKNMNFKYENHRRERICGSFEYLGKEYINKPHLNIHIDYNSKCDIKIIEKDLNMLKEKYYITVITGNVKEDNPIDLICQKLGIRTMLLYYRGKIISKYKDKKIITKYDEKFSNRVREFYLK